MGESRVVSMSSSISAGVLGLVLGMLILVLRVPGGPPGEQVVRASAAPARAPTTTADVLVSTEAVTEPVVMPYVATTAPRATVPAPPPPAPVSGSDDAVWDRLAQCESGGNWSINTGNGYYGGLQFSAATWRSVGGTGLPHQHSRETQIHFGKILQQRSGWGQWPACSRKLGLR